MKKIVFLMVLFTAINLHIFAQQADQEEIDYLLFLPNSSNQFADEARARTQLDNVARYLRSKSLTDAQIYVYGYAADVQNDIDPSVLSRDRALFVINELVKRGVGRNYFNNPVGYGSVNTWGNNANEMTRVPNRRVRILFEDIMITPELVEEAEEEILAFEAAEAEAVYEPAPVVQDSDSFNWWWLLLLLLPLLLLLWPKKKHKQQKPAEVKPVPVAKPADAALLRPKGGEPKYYRLTEEEIRNKAYELFAERNYEHGHHDEDWLRAISLLFAKYEAQGYIVLWP